MCLLSLASHPVQKTDISSRLWRNLFCAPECVVPLRIEKIVHRERDGVRHCVGHKADPHRHIRQCHTVRWAEFRWQQGSDTVDIGQYAASIERRRTGNATVREGSFDGHSGEPAWEISMKSNPNSCGWHCGERVSITPAPTKRAGGGVEGDSWTDFPFGGSFDSR